MAHGPTSRTDSGRTSKNTAPRIAPAAKPVSAAPCRVSHSQPLRYVAIRIEKKQGHLYDDGSRIRRFAVVTNIEEWTAPKLIQWHREKTGTVEMIQDILKNELAAGVLPCGRFGVNAAWLRWP
jgi:hypothetical protein